VPDPSDGRRHSRQIRTFDMRRERTVCCGIALCVRCPRVRGGEWVGEAQARPACIHGRGTEIDLALRAIIDEAVAKKAPLVEIIPGRVPVP